MEGISFPFLEVGAYIVRLAPMFLVDPYYALVFWVVIFLVTVQYRRIATMEKNVYGVVKNRPLRQTALATIQGLVGGLAGSYLMVLVGVTLTGSGIRYLLPIALLLMLFSPRLLCFSYAGGLISLSYLLFGVPVVSIPGIMALVAILHITESILIYFTGYRCATPLFFRNRRGEVVGGFTLQRFWPVPIVIMVLLNWPLAEAELLRMPGWWPLVAPEVTVPESGPLVYTLIPVMAALGYGDLAVSMPPRQKSRRTAGMLAVFSLILLTLAVVSSRIPAYQWVAALFAPIGHEAVAVLGSRRELRGRPYYSRPRVGVRILDVLPGLLGARAGLEVGDVILEVNGLTIGDRNDLLAALATGDPRGLSFTLEREGRRTVRRSHVRVRPGENWGIVLVPGPTDETHMELRMVRPLPTLLGRLVRAVRGLTGGTR